MAEPIAPKVVPPPRHFGHGPLAQRLAYEVFDSLLPDGERHSELHPKTSGRLGPALVVGVFGEWGAGKSFLLKEVGEEIKQLREKRAETLAKQHPPGTEAGEPPTEITVLVEFNAWRFEREPHLLIPMLKVAEQAMRDEVERAVPTDSKRREWLADHLALLGTLIEGVYTNGGRQALQMWLDAQGAALKLPEPAKEGKPTEPSFWEKLRSKKKALSASREISTPIPALESLYFNFFEYLRGITGRNPNFLRNVQQRLSQGGLGTGIAALHHLEQAGRWVATGQTREPARLHVNLVFLVDDLDRCLPEKAIEVLEAVKLFLDVEGCAFVLALDEEVVERGIAHRYQAYTSAAQGQTPITGAEYLEKLIHLPIRLPRPHASEAQQFLADLWPALYAKRPDQSSPQEANDLAKLVAAITPPVPRKLQRITSLMQLNKAFSGVMRSDSGPMSEADQRAWLALICALQLFAPSLFRYLRIHGAGLLTEVVQWRSELRLNNLGQLKLDLREATASIKEVAQLRDAYAREALPDLVSVALQNRSGFSLIAWCAEAERLLKAAPPSATQLGYLLSLTVSEDKADAQAKSLREQVAGLGDVAVDAAIDLAKKVAEDLGREAVGALIRRGPILARDILARFHRQQAQLDREGDLLEALMARDPSVLPNALSREGANLQDRFLPDGLLHRFAEHLNQDPEHWLVRADLAADDPRPAALNPLLSQSQVLALGDRLAEFQRLQLMQRLARPSWAKAWSRDLNDYLLHTPAVPLRTNGVKLKGYVDSLQSSLQSPRAWIAEPIVEQQNDAISWTLGADGEYGLYLDLRLENITQRLRWMEPGGFLMGSAEGRNTRKEGPQHLVHLSQGFWLADTPCTQQLWQALMGRNPSDRQGVIDAAQHPVGNVSFEDTQAFLIKLGTFLPAGWLAALPTEAQWEYACRADTLTDFWWGDAPDHSLANWQNQQLGSTPVTRYPPNPWGLHDVHGNVQEWCLDGLRVYSGRTAIDPVGDTKGDARVLRGGSWFGYHETARSAYRFQRSRGTRKPIQGFRFALKPSGL